MSKIGVILAGSGVYDGSEIHEAVFTLLAIDELGHEVRIYAPDKPQHHVVNHITGDEMSEQRNVMVESARIARGEISPLSDFAIEDVDALVIPGGFGAAKNLNQWALKGPEGTIDPDVVNALNLTSKAGKPICGLCMGPTVIAQALGKITLELSLTIGSINEPSPYDIESIQNGMQSFDVKTVDKGVPEIHVDEVNKVVSAPCYMMNAGIATVKKNIDKAIKATVDLI